MKAKKSKIIIFFQNYWPYLAYFLISIILLSPILFHRGLPLSQDWAWPLFNPGRGFWQQFSDFGAGYLVIFGKYPLLILSGLGYIFRSSDLLFRLVILLLHFFSASFFFLLMKKQLKSTPVAFVAGLAYAFTPYFFIRTIIGYLFSLIAYTLLPLFFLIFLPGKKSIWRYLTLGFILSIIFSQTQAGLLLSLVLIIYAIISLFYRRIRPAVDFALTYLALIAINLPWIIYTARLQKTTALVSGVSVTTLGRMAVLPYSYRLMLMSADFEFTNNYFMLLSHNKFYLFGWLVVWLVCFFAIFNKSSSFVERAGRPLIIALIISAASVIPFYKGPSGRFGGFYLFVYNHFPQIMVFRDTHHFEFLFAFVLIVLFAFGLDWIWQTITKIQDTPQLSSGLARNKQISNNKSQKLISLILTSSKALLAASIVVIIYPYFTFNYAGYLPIRQIPASYNQLYDYLQGNKDLCHKIYYPPGLDFVYFKSDQAPIISNGDTIAASFDIPRLHGGSSILSIPSPEMYYQNELLSQFYEKSDNGEFVSVLNEGEVDCVIVRQDLDTKYAQAMNLKYETDPAILDKWNQNDWLSLARSKKGLSETKSFGDNIYIFKINDQVTRDKKQTNSNFQNSNQVGNSAIEQFNPSTSLGAGNRTIVQLPLSDWADVNTFYKYGWTRGRYDFWRKLIFARLRQDFIYTDRPDTDLSGKINQAGSYELWARYLDGGTAGNLEIKIQDTRYKIQKNTGEEKFVWKKLGDVELSGQTTVLIKNINGENAIADLVLVK